MSVMLEILRLYREFPDWLAWRIDTFATRARDLDLSPSVRDAMRAPR